MHILLAAATRIEIQPVIDLLAGRDITLLNNEVTTGVYGVGMLAATYNLQRMIRTYSPDFVICAGIAGGFGTQFKLEEVVQVREEFLGDMGVEEKGEFFDVFDMNLQPADEFPFFNKTLHSTDLDVNLKAARGVTVNMISTKTSTIEFLQKKYRVGIETMEGAAVHYVCLKEEVPFLHIRSISNEVGERNKKDWKLGESIMKLNDELIRIINLLESGSFAWPVTLTNRRSKKY